MNVSNDFSLSRSLSLCLSLWPLEHSTESMRTSNQQRKFHGKRCGILFITISINFAQLILYSQFHLFFPSFPHKPKRTEILFEICLHFSFNPYIIKCSEKSSFRLINAADRLVIYSNDFLLIMLRLGSRAEGSERSNHLSIFDASRAKANRKWQQKLVLL